MSALTTDEKTSLRQEGHSSRMYLAVLVPDDVFTATVSNDEDRGATVIEYGSITGTDADALAGQIVWFGSSAGAHDIGVARIKAVASVANSLTIEENDLDLAAGDHITVKKMWLPRTKLPTIDNSGADVTFTKDSDTYIDENENIPPVVVMGPPDCQFIDAGTGVATCEFVDAYSHSLVDAALSTKTWGWDGGTETGGAGTVADPYTVTFSTAGTYWISLEITDANGATATGYRPVFIFDSDNLPYRDFKAGPRQSSLQGTRQQFEVFGDAAQTDLPDHTWVVRFNRDWYATTEEALDTRYPSRGHIKFVGYLLSDTLEYADDISSVRFEAIDITYMLNLLPGFGNVLKDRSSPSTWLEMYELDVIKAVYWLLKWHTTALEICDFRYSLALSDSEIRMREQRWGKGSIWQQCNQILAQKGIFANLCATVQGCLEIRQDPCLMKTADRAANVTTVVDLLTSDYATIQLQRRPRHQVQTVRVGGFSYDGATATPLMAKAPGVPDAALQEPRYDGLVLSATDGQSGLNRIAGDLAAKLNNEEPLVRIALPGNWDVFDAALQERVTFALAAADNIRELDYDSTDDWIVREVQTDENVAEGYVEQVTLTLERETDGEDGLTVDIVEPDEVDWPEPPLPSQPRPEPIPSEDPLARISQYIVCTNVGVFAIDLDATGAAWTAVNDGLASDAARNVYEFKKDSFKWTTNQRVWCAGRDGIYRMDGWPNGTWTQVISVSDIETAIGNSLDSPSYPYRFRMAFSAEVEDLFCVAINCGIFVGGNGQTTQLCVVQSDSIVNAYQTFLIAGSTEDDAGWPAVRFDNTGGFGNVIYAVANRRPFNLSDSQAKLWKTIDQGSNWSDISTISPSNRGVYSSVSVPYSGGGDIIYWGRGAGVAGSSSEYRKSVNAGTSFANLAGAADGYAKIGTGNGNPDLVFVLASDLRSSAGGAKYSISGGDGWTLLPYYDETGPSSSSLISSFVSWSGQEIAEIVVGGSLASYLVLSYTQGAAAWTNQTLNLEDFGVTTINQIERCQIE